jgi:hypothetical protein
VGMCEDEFDTLVLCNNCFVHFCGNGSKRTVVPAAVTAGRTCRVRVSFLS